MESIWLLLNLSIVHWLFDLVEFQHYKRHDFLSIVFIFLDRTFTDVEKLFRLKYERFSLIVLISVMSHLSKKHFCRFLWSSLIFSTNVRKTKRIWRNKEKRTIQYSIWFDVSCELFIERFWMKCRVERLMSKQTNWFIKEENSSWAIGSFYPFERNQIVQCRRRNI